MAEDPLVTTEQLFPWATGSPDACATFIRGLMRLPIRAQNSQIEAGMLPLRAFAGVHLDKTGPVGGHFGTCPADLRSSVSASSVEHEEPEADGHFETTGSVDTRLVVGSGAPSPQRIEEHAAQRSGGTAFAQRLGYSGGYLP